MEDTRITFETAKLAKEKGCNLENCTCGGYPDCICSDKRISQSLLAKWLREEYSIHVTSQIGNLDFISTYHYDIRYISKNKFMCKVKGSYKTYEEALEAGLYQALLLL